jgi:hypothetical protein
MAKELPILASAPQQPDTKEMLYSRVFCVRENSPPLRLLLDFLKAKGQIPLIPKMDPAALDDWAWVHVTLGYHRERAPIQVFCVRDRGTYEDVHKQEKEHFLSRLSLFDEIEAQLVREHITRSRFILTTRMVKQDVTEEGYDFNGWILEFFQDQCNGIVQVDGQGFFTPKGELAVELDWVNEETS